jgi:hypothetical protein
MGSPPTAGEGNLYRRERQTPELKSIAPAVAQFLHITIIEWKRRK